MYVCTSERRSYFAMEIFSNNSLYMICKLSMSTLKIWCWRFHWLGNEFQCDHVPIIRLMYGKMILVLSVKTHTSASNQGRLFSFLPNFIIQWIPKTSGMKLLIVVTKNEEIIKFYMYYICLLRNYSNVFS